MAGRLWEALVPRIAGNEILTAKDVIGPAIVRLNCRMHGGVRSPGNLGRPTALLNPVIQELKW